MTQSPDARLAEYFRPAHRPATGRYRQLAEAAELLSGSFPRDLRHGLRLLRQDLEDHHGQTLEDLRALARHGAVSLLSAADGLETLYRWRRARGRGGEHRLRRAMAAGDSFAQTLAHLAAVVRMARGVGAESTVRKLGGLIAQALTALAPYEGEMTEGEARAVQTARHHLAA